MSGLEQEVKVAAPSSRHLKLEKVGWLNLKVGLAFALGFAGFWSKVGALVSTVTVSVSDCGPNQL